MEKFKSFLNSYFWLIALIFVLIIGVLVFSIASAYQEQSLQKSITAGVSEAGKAKNEAANADRDAADFDTTRRTEDVIREKAIAPRLESARRQSEKSSQKIKILKKQINENEKDIHNINASVTDNCAELHRLLPDEKFEYCLD